MIGLKVLWVKEKMQVSSIFSFSLIVFKIIFCGVVKMSELFGKRLNFTPPFTQGQICSLCRKVEPYTTFHPESLGYLSKKVKLYTTFYSESLCCLSKIVKPYTTFQSESLCCLSKKDKAYTTFHSESLCCLSRKVTSYTTFHFHLTPPFTQSHFDACVDLRSDFTKDEL